MAILTTAHAQLTRGRQEALGPKITNSLGHLDRDIPFFFLVVVYSLACMVLLVA